MKKREDRLANTSLTKHEFGTSIGVLFHNVNKKAENYKFLFAWNWFVSINICKCHCTLYITYDNEHLKIIWMPSSEEQLVLLPLYDSILSALEIIVEKLTLVFCIMLCRVKNISLYICYFEIYVCMCVYV